MEKQIEKVLWKEYGIGILAADPTVIKWAAAKCEDPEKARKYANRLRSKAGRIHVY